MKVKAKVEMGMIIAIGLFVGVLSSCGEKRNDMGSPEPPINSSNSASDHNQDGQPRPTPPIIVQPPPAENVPVSPLNPSMRGQWVSNCRDSILFGLGQRDHYQNDGQTGTKISDFYTTGDCQNLAVEVKQFYSLEEKSEVHQGLRDVDFLVSKVSVTPKSALGLELLKASKFCGRENWKENEVVDVTGSTGGSGCFTQTPIKVPQIMTIKDQRLYLGLREGLLTSENRPNVIDEDAFYVKEP